MSARPAKLTVTVPVLIDPAALVTLDIHPFVASLADDPRLLKTLLVDALAKLKEHHVRLGELTHSLKELQRWQFGSRSERVPAEQLLFAFVQAFNVAERPLSAAATSQEPPKPKKIAAPHGRNLKRIVPTGDVPTIVTILDLPEEEKKCKCCKSRLVQISLESSQKLDIRPPQASILETRRPKYACSNCELHGVAIADLPVDPFPKSLATPNLMAWTAVQKFQFHIPLYRQSQIYKSQGIVLSDSTLGGWIKLAAELLEPVHGEMKKDVLKSDILNADDSPMRILDHSPAYRHRTREGALATYLGDENHRHAVYEFAPDRRHHWAQDFLAHYTGRLQADAWKGYDKVFERGLAIEIGCMAHLRRYFFKAKDTDSERALVALGLIRKLYEIEAQAKEQGLSSDQTYILRQACAVPVLEAFKLWLRQEAPRVVPRTPMEEAFTYAQNQWIAICRYVEDGRLSIGRVEYRRAS